MEIWSACRASIWFWLRIEASIKQNIYFCDFSNSYKIGRILTGWFIPRNKCSNYTAIPAHIFFLSPSVFSVAEFVADLDSVASVVSFDDGASVKTSGFCTGFSSKFSVLFAMCTSITRVRKQWKVGSLIIIRLWMSYTCTEHRGPQWMFVTGTKYLPVQLSAATQTERRQNVFLGSSYPPPDGKINWRKRRTSWNYTLFQEHSPHFKLFEIALRC